MDEGTMFASRSLTEHLLRGLLGGALLVAAFGLASRAPLALLLLVPAGLLLRGCPTCWAVGLGQTLSRRRLARSCDDGVCRLQAATRS